MNIIIIISIFILKKCIFFILVFNEVYSIAFMKPDIIWVHFYIYTKKKVRIFFIVAKKIFFIIVKNFLYSRGKNFL